jgi:hypothetical protein
MQGINQWAVPGSNRGPPACKTGQLHRANIEVLALQSGERALFGPLTTRRWVPIGGDSGGFGHHERPGAHSAAASSSSYAAPIWQRPARGSAPPVSRISYPRAHVRGVAKIAGRPARGSAPPVDLATPDACADGWEASSFLEAVKCSPCRSRGNPTEAMWRNCPDLYPLAGIWHEPVRVGLTVPVDHVSGDRMAYAIRVTAPLRLTVQTVSFPTAIARG